MSENSTEAEIIVPEKENLKKYKNKPASMAYKAIMLAYAVVNPLCEFIVFYALPKIYSIPVATFWIIMFQLFYFVIGWNIYKVHYTYPDVIPEKYYVCY